MLHINTAIYYALLLLIVLAPIPFGSNREWSWSLCALMISLISLIWAVNNAWNQHNVSLSFPVLIIVLFLIPVLWAVLQAVNLMPDSWVHPLWAMTSEALDRPISATISLAPGNSLTAVMRLICYGLVFLLSFQFCRNRARAKTTLNWLAIAGIVYALYGLMIYWTHFNVFFWIEPGSKFNSLSSTFVNRNSYVTYAGLGLICLMVRSLANVSHAPGASHESLMGKQKKIEYYIFSSWKPLLGLMLITTALISTNSRGGFISVAPAVLVLLLIYVARARLKSRTRLVSVGAVLVIILLAFSTSNSSLLQRLTLVESGGAERLEVYQLTINATRDSPLMGFGYGAFEEGFRAYRSEDIQYLYDKAHNTYLENSFELGLPAASALFMALAGTLWLAIRGTIRRRRDWLYPATGVAASVLVGVHSLVDFSLQIPAVALTYAAIMGLAVAQSFSAARHHS